MKFFGVILTVFVLTLTPACNQTEVYNQKIKTLDSLSGALNIKVKELQKTDTAVLQRCILKYNYYRQFIKQNVKDTLTKNEGDNLQRFYESGKNLESFWSNRFVLLSRAALINGQQTKLSADIKNHLISTEQAAQYTVREKEATEELIQATIKQQNLFYSGLEEFKSSLQEVENLIRLRNKDKLPTIVRDSIAL